MPVSVGRRSVALRAQPLLNNLPQGRPLTHDVVMELLAPDEGLILLASRYEGVDERLLRSEVGRQP